MTNADEEPRTLLAALIATRNLSYDEAARRITDTARDDCDGSASISERHLRRLARRERDGAGTTPAVARALERTFGFPVRDLLAPYSSTALVVQPHGTVTSTTQEVVTMAADRARRFVTASTSGTSADAIDLIRDDVRELARAYPSRPLTEVLGHLVSGQDAIFTLLEQPQRPAHGRDLYFLAGVVGGLLAKASHDLADPTAAQTQARTAWMCAEQADHHGLRAWISGLQSLVAYWAKRPTDAIRYAHRGAQHAEQARSTASIWLASNEARAWAALGNAGNAAEAIERAENAWASVEPDDLDELGGIATFSRPRQVYYAADALAWLDGNSSSALEYAGDAVAAYSDPTDPDWAFGDSAGSHCDLAIARLRQRDVEGAADTMTQVLALPPEQRINGIVHSVNRVHDALRPFSETATAATLIGEIEAYTRVPLQALPR